MAKKVKSFEQNLVEIKKKLSKFSKEAIVLAKKGEKEFIRLSKEGKLRVDSATVGVKKEHLLYLIGKEYVRLDCPGEKSPKLKKLIADLKDAQKKGKVLKRTIKRTKSRKT